MRELDIFTDDNCNIPKTWLVANNVGFLPLGVLLDGHDCPPELVDNPTEFYAQVRAGHKPSTSSIPALLVEETFENSVRAGHDVLYIGLPAALSSNFEHIQGIAKAVSKKFADSNEQVDGHQKIPQISQIHCMDARIACTGHALILEEAVKLRDNGASLPEIIPALEDLSDHLLITFMVDNMQYISAGGRAADVVEQIVKMAAKLKIKPVLTVNRLCNIKFHAISRKRSKGIEQLVNLMLNGMDKSAAQIIHVLHADAISLAQSLMEAIKSALGEQQKMELREVSPVIGAHVGPGTVALVYKLAQARS